ncbi:MAG: 7-carboxy-7-deazaguanine synthase [Myxococcales bacterium]|nr:7-carboxy-7-deazaguanine synthase [Myxococcales bacterium]
MYAVKELFLTLQGEGAHAGRAAVFVRFTGCNLWSGRAEDRARGAGGCAAWCDTDFVGTDGGGGGRFATADQLADAAAAAWGDRGAHAFVVCTGGEPLLQLDAALIDALHARGFEIAIETNGTQPIPAGVDWVCVSPKAGAALVVAGGDELKLVYPQPGQPAEVDPARLVALPFRHYFLQPRDGDERAATTAACVAYCRDHPPWRVSLQTHKLLRIP